MPYPWSAGNVLTATDLNSALAAKTDTAMVQNAQTGTSYSYALADASKLLTMSNAASNTVLVTKQATVTWVTGTQLRVVNLGAGVTTLVADTGVTINGNVALKQYQGGTLIRTASDVWLFVPTASSSGMDLITPTSVAGSGVTLSGGQVSFSAATSVSVNGCFTSAYDNYVLLFNVDTFAASSALTFRLRASGSDNATSDYSYAGFFNSSYATPTLNSDGGSGQTSWAGTTQVSYGAMVLNLQNPQRAQRTFGSYFIAAGTNVANYGYRFGAATQFDGISFLSASAATGTARIYGLRNS